MSALAAKTRFALFGILASLLPTAVGAEELQLRPRMQAGDSYRLSLSVLTDTEAFSKGEGGENFAETVRLHYQAAVEVLEADAGRPVRERHDRAVLTFERPGESGSLFKEGVTLEIGRAAGIEVYLGGRRVDRKLEKVLADVLEKQFEFTLEPAVLEPGRPVEVGSSWTPHEDLARRFLLSRGMKVVEFGEGATARLLREPVEGGEMAWVVDYVIPVSRFVLTQMPPHAEASRTEARLEGRIRLTERGALVPVSARSNLTLSLNGVSKTTAQSMPWRVRSSVTVEKSSTPSGDLAAFAPTPTALR